MQDTRENLLGDYLKGRRTKLDPAAFGFSMSRRRTPGLRREEVAQRANVSPTWYTWLEQGRGGAPSAHVLERIAKALLLSDAEREHLFLLGLGRAPDVRPQATTSVSARVQRVLNSLATSPALVRNAAWDVLAWNRAAAAALIDYGQLAPAQRNILRLVFCNPKVRAVQPDWESVARFVVATFRAEAARAGMPALAQQRVDEMRRDSPEFDAMWQEHDVRSHGEGTKFIRHPEAGLITLEYSSFAVDGEPDLGMVVYTPYTVDDVARIQRLIEGYLAGKRAGGARREAA